MTLQVLPFEAGAHAGLDGGFTIVGFELIGDPDVVYLEHTTSDLYLEDSIEFLVRVPENPLRRGESGSIGRGGAQECPQRPKRLR
jgi:hypothetical protein